MGKYDAESETVANFLRNPRMWEYASKLYKNCWPYTKNCWSYIRIVGFMQELLALWRTFGLILELLAFSKILVGLGQ